MRALFGVSMVVLGLPLTVHAAGASAAADMTQRVAQCVVQAGVLLLATKVGNLIFCRARVPGVLGELAAGVVMGPFLLGALALPGFPAGLFPLTGGFPLSPGLSGVGSITAVLLLFMIGLRTDICRLVHHSAVATAVGSGGVVAAFLVGDLTGVLFGAPVFGRSMGFGEAPCLFLGVVSAATAAGITARVLSELRRLDTPEAITALAGAVVGDVLGLVGLAVVVGLSGGDGTHGVGWGGVASIAAKGIGVWLLATLVGRVVAQRAGASLRRERGRQSLAILALGVTLVLAGWLDTAGLPMVIGAYVMGLTLSRTDAGQATRERLDPLYALLVPLLVAGIGMQVDVRALGNAQTLRFGLLYTALAVTAKVIGSGAPAMLFGFSLRGALRVGAGMLPRAEVALIVAGAGLAMGALPRDVFSVTVMMAVVTMVCARPVLAALFRNADPGAGGSEAPRSAEVIRLPCGTSRQAEWIVNGLQDTLQRDGFLVDVLEPEEGDILALRGRTSITFRREHSDIVFNCEPSALPVVKTAVLYVVREMRAALEAMRRPMDVQRLWQDIPSSAPVTADPHDLRPYLRSDLVKLRLQGTTGSEVLREMVALVEAAGLVRNGAEVLAEVVARENSMSTGLERGIAVPHCRTDAVKGLVCAIGLKPEGLDFGAFDGQPSRVFVLTLSPVSEPTPHVQFMSQVVQVLTPSACRRLLRAESTHEVIAIMNARPEVEPAPAVAPVPRQPVPHAIRANALTDAVVLPRLRATTKEGAIDELLGALTAVHPMDDLAQVRRQLLQREQLMSTGLERGIAVPHCRTAAVSRVLCALGLKPEGLDFGSQDGAPTQVVVLILASTSMPTPYAQTLAMLLRALNHIPHTELFACTDAAALRALILHTMEGAGEASGDGVGGRVGGRLA